MPIIYIIMGYNETLFVILACDTWIKNYFYYCNSQPEEVHSYDYIKWKNINSEQM